MAEMRRPFATGIAVGAIGVFVWVKRGWFIERFRRMAAVFSGPISAETIFPPPSTALTGLPPAAQIAVRQIRRYTFAAMQDQSPVVGLTHASYALMGLDLLEETAGREAIQRAGYDPAAVRALITQQQDRHAETLRACDPYLGRVLDLERERRDAGFALHGGAPTGA